MQKRLAWDIQVYWALSFFEKTIAAIIAGVIVSFLVSFIVTFVLFNGKETK